MAELARARGRWRTACVRAAPFGPRLSGRGGGFPLMIRAAHKQPGFVAALLHRFSGIALAVFLPFHFLALALALQSANALDGFLRITAEPLVEVSEAALVAALGLHMALGIRILAIEFLGFHERTFPAVSLCVGSAVVLFAAFFLSAG